MAKATGTIDFSGIPANTSTIVIDDGQSVGHSQVTFRMAGTAGGGGEGTLAVDANGFAKVLDVYNNHTTSKGFMRIAFHIDTGGGSGGGSNADFKDMATGGSTPLIYEFTDPAGNVVNITLVNESSGFSSNVSGASYARKDSAGNYSINTNNAGVNHDNIAEELKDILVAADAAGEIVLGAISRQSTYWLQISSNAAGDAPFSFRIKRASGSWSNTASPAATVTKSTSGTGTSNIRAQLSAPDEPVYSQRNAETGGSGTLSATEFAAYFARMLNGLPIQITATASGTQVSLENDNEGTAGNVTITTSGTTNATVSGMSGGSASGGGGSMAKRLTISAEQIAVSSSGGIASSGDNKPALMLSYTALAAQNSAGDDDLLSIHVDGELVPKKIKVSELIASFAGGSDTQVQFNDSNALGGDAGLTYYKSSNALFVSGAVHGTVFSGSGTSTLHQVNVDALTADGAVTAGSSFIIGSADLNETDLEKLDGITNGTAAANKAVVVDGSKDISSLRNVEGVLFSGSGTSTLHKATLDEITVNGVISGSGVSTIHKVTADQFTAGTKIVLGTADLNQTDLEQIDDITAGTAAANKALVLDANKNIGGITTLTASFARIDELDVVTINSFIETEQTLQIQDKLIVSALSASSAQADGGGLQIGGKQGDDTVASVVYSHSGTKMLHKIADSTIASVKPTGLDVAGTLSGSGVISGLGLTVGSAVMDETDLEKLDGITDGTAAANKAVVLDNNKDVSGLRNVSGAILSGSGVSTLHKVTADSITVNGIVSGSGVSTIHKITSDGLTVNGVISGSGTSTIHKINVDSLTADGAVTAGSSFIIGSADLNEADLEKLDGITDGTAAANKAVVVDANKDVSSLRDVSGRIFSGSGTSTLSGLTADNATVGTRLVLSGSKVGTEIADVAVANDYFMFLDGGDDGDIKKESIKDLVTAQAGSGIQATNGVFSLSHVIDRYRATASFDSDGSTKYDFAPITGTPSSDNCVSVYINGLHLSLSSSVSGITDHWDYKIDSSRLVFNAGTDINIGDEIVIKYVAS